MNQYEQYPAVDDSELTVVTPHFTVQEARMARPVVPLPAAADATSSTASDGRARGRRLWSIPMIIISAVLGGAAGSLALNFFQASQSSPSNAAALSNSSPAAAVATMPSVALTPASEVAPTVVPLVTAQGETPQVSSTEVPAAQTVDTEAGSSPTPNAASRNISTVPTRDKAASRGTERRETERKAEDDQPAVARATPSGRSTEPTITATGNERQESSSSSGNRDNNIDQDNQDREDSSRSVERERRTERRREAAERRELPSPTPVARPRQPSEQQQQQQQRIRDRINEVFEGRRPQQQQQQ